MKSGEFRRNFGQDSVFQQVRKWIEANRLTAKSAFGRFARGAMMLRPEFKSVLDAAAPKAKLSSWQVEHLMQLLDTNGNGKITLDEW